MVADGLMDKALFGICAVGICQRENWMEREIKIVFGCWRKESIRGKKGKRTFDVHKNLKFLPFSC